MSLLRPIHWYHSRADLIRPVGPFYVKSGLVFSFTVIMITPLPPPKKKKLWLREPEENRLKKRA